MYRTISSLLCWILLSLNATAQTFVQHDPISLPVHKAHVGEIKFLSQQLDAAQVKESDFLQQFTVQGTIPLEAKVFLPTSLTNALHVLAPNDDTTKLVKNGSYQFSFYVDGKLVYKENLNAGASTPEIKNRRTIIRIPLISYPFEDHWGNYLWNRFIARGGGDALYETAHKLRVEMRPLIYGKVGDIIASGDLTFSWPYPTVSADQKAVQKIAPYSDIPLSKEKIDTGLIIEMNKRIQQGFYKNIRSIVVIKNGKVLLEEYFNNTHRASLLDTRSVGKTFAAALLGIAIDKKYIKNEHARIGDFYSISDPNKANVTLENLMTMTAGFAGDDNNQDSPGNEENMYPTSNWVKFTLDLPMDSSMQRGKDWQYFTAGVLLTGDIINQKVPNGLEKFAQENLFKPLHIQQSKWVYTPQKVPSTAGGLELSALDFAKFGMLYLQNGQWKNKQVMSAEWVKKSMQHHAQLPGTEDEFYGYWLWNKTYTVKGKPYETYYCSGNGGNKIFIFKEQNMVVVVASNAYNMPYAHPQVDKIMSNYLLPAVL
ncbi:CubicO group peptidase (beta-lactamase class C family) [Chitinophaga skermanii]|uniref:CubicO group peptidase (Beta-lactamase class C family) n=1 Tax=Chitinophaga skermanii TaxID=331697 RepID=A0A327R9W3_9BACT|nr:serine hydrolase [Chitinophaga skermanii]RAJ10707.1 CubicO group peptidase (beta-lactamase class C family) [Chitinophaga skermanii]